MPSKRGALVIYTRPSVTREWLECGDVTELLCLYKCLRLLKRKQLEVIVLPSVHGSTLSHRGILVQIEVVVAAKDDA